MPRGRSLYGPLPAQLDDPDSFASRLTHVLRVREASGIATATQIEVPACSHPGVLVMVHDDLPGVLRQATVLNFSADPVDVRVTSYHFTPGWSVVDELTGEELGEVDELHGLDLSLEAHQGRFLTFSAGAAGAE
jgi:hypothetical protein